MNTNPTIDQLNEADGEYEIVVNRMADIINIVSPDTEEEKLIMEAIITNIETTAAKFVKDGKIAQLPAIGCIRKNPVKQAVRANYNNFKHARTVLNKEDYADHVRGYVNEAKEKLAKEEREKLRNRKVRSINKKMYDKLYTTLGRAHAELYILSLRMFSEVPYDAEVQAMFDRLNGVTHEEE